MNTTQAILLVAVAIFMGWFAVGILWNIRHGNAILKWMQAGLPAIGEKTTLRWLGSSVVELNINKARPPFRRFTLLVVMVPRDVPWLWLWSLLRGRRDTVILRGQLTSTPRLEYEFADPKSWTGQSALKTATRLQWVQEPLAGLEFVAPKASQPVSIQEAPAFLENARQVHPIVWRLAVHREFPQLELHVPPPNIRNADAERFFEAVRFLGQKIAG